MFAIITFSFLSSKVVNACETAKVWFRECLLAILEFFRYLPPSSRVPIFRQVIEEWKFWLWDALNFESGNNNVRHDTTFRFVGTYWNLNRRHQNMPKQTSLPPKYLHKAIQLCNFFTILVNNTVISADRDQVYLDHNHQFHLRSDVQCFEKESGKSNNKAAESIQEKNLDWAKW